MNKTERKLIDKFKGTLINYTSYDIKLNNSEKKQ